MRRKIRVAELADLIGHDFDFSRRRLERMLLRIGAKRLKQHELAHRRRQLHKTFGPELLEARQTHALTLGAGAESIVKELAPAHFVAAFGEGGLIAEAIGQRAENIAS